MACITIQSLLPRGAISQSFPSGQSLIGPPDRIGSCHVSIATKEKKLPKRGRVFCSATTPWPLRPYTSVVLIPTGVGAAIGGFAGDGGSVARAVGAVADRVVTHPNVLNGAMMYWPEKNCLYVEGYGLDRFAEGDWGLRPVHQNTVGLVVDRGVEGELLERHRQVVDAARATLGISIEAIEITDEPMGISKWIDPVTGVSTGKVENPGTLMRAIERLVRGEGGRGRERTLPVNAVAVAARFPDDSLEEIEDYRHGQGVDALSGVEAVISHMVVEQFRIPCAHAPALSPLPLDYSISARSAAEEIGYTFLPCVLAGLSRAPQFVEREGFDWTREGGGIVWSHDVDSVIVPASSCGGRGTLAFARKKGPKPLIIAVEENETVLNDTPESLGIEAIRVKNYWEAIGVIAAHKAGLNPMALRRNGVSNIKIPGILQVASVFG